MSNLITLMDFHRESAHYYVYRRKESDISYMPHYHDYFQLCFITDGEVMHSQGNDCVTLQAGQTFIIPPGFVHKLRFLGDDSEVYTLAFQEESLRDPIASSGASHFLKDLQTLQEIDAVHLCLTPDADQSRSIDALFRCLLQQQDADCPPELSAAPHLIYAIVSILAQCYYRNPKNKRQPWNASDNAQLLRRCIAYVDTHYTEVLSADDLAKQFGLSRSTLCSAFQQHTGLPLHKYIAQKRVHQAQILIRSQANTPLTEISARVGYEDNSTFYRNFLKITGISPAKYRELYGKR